MLLSENITKWIEEQTSLGKTSADMDGQFFVQGTKVAQLKKSGKKINLNINFGAVKFEEGDPS